MDSFGRVTLKYDPYYGQLIHNIESSKKGRSVKIGSDHKTARRLEELIKTYRYSPYAALVRMDREGSLYTSLSVGTVYRYIHQGVLDIAEDQLPHGRSRKKRKVKRAFGDRANRINLRGGKSIEARPLSVLNRREFGHWEGDLVLSARPGHTAIFTLVERKTRMIIAIKLRNKTQEEVKRAMDMVEAQFGYDTRRVFKPITFDNGTEFHEARDIAKSLLAPGSRVGAIYYAHPHCPGERGTNEVSNKLLRRFFPKKQVFDRVSSADVTRVAMWMNDYPRRKLNGKTANEAFRAELELLGMTSLSAA